MVYFVVSEEWFVTISCYGVWCRVVFAVVVCSFLEHGEVSDTSKRLKMMLLLGTKAIHFGLRRGKLEGGWRMEGGLGWGDTKEGGPPCPSLPFPFLSQEIELRYFRADGGAS